MRTIPNVETHSERGVALVIVLLLMAVLSGLATGFAMNGRVEATMAQNEVYYAGARAAAEAGINRATAAVRLEDAVHLLRGQDDLADLNAAAAVNADNGNIGFLLAGASPYNLVANGEYRYEVEVLDDDDPALYNGVALNAAQLMALGPPAVGENGSGDVDTNTRLILRATGYGPQNTVVRVARVLLTTIIPIPGSTVNPAILVDGDVTLDGNVNLLGSHGSIHANEDLTISGNSADIIGDATASGTFTSTSNNLDVGGQSGGGYGNINVPETRAADFEAFADYKLSATGLILNVSTGISCLPAACPGDLDEWSFSDPDGVLGPQMGTWDIGGNTAPTGTFYAEGKISISGSPDAPGPGNNPLEMTLIATGSISLTGSPTLKPDNNLDGRNPSAIQFVTDGDLKIGGNAGLSQTQVEGQIFVREQIQTQGTWDFRGRIIVQDDANDFNEVVGNSIGGTPTITYDGTLPGYVIPPTTEYTYNVTGWLES